MRPDDPPAQSARCFVGAACSTSVPPVRVCSAARAQARVCVLIVGVSGIYMAWRLELWSRFQSAAFWWMHAMVLVWLLFTLMLFVVEPVVLRHRRRHRPRDDAREPQAMLHSCCAPIGSCSYSAC
jgi:hypothetical protein